MKNGFTVYIALYNVGYITGRSAVIFDQNNGQNPALLCIQMVVFVTVVGLCAMAVAKPH